MLHLHSVFTYLHGRWQDVECHLHVGRSKGIGMPKSASRDRPVTRGDLAGVVCTMGEPKYRRLRAHFIRKYSTNIFCILYVPATFAQ